MALITCPECKKEVSNQADMCPHCGYSFVKEAKKRQEDKKKRRKRKIWIWCLVGFGLFAIIGSINPNKDTNKQPSQKPVETKQPPKNPVPNKFVRSGDKGIITEDKDGVAKYELVFQRERTDTVINRSDKDRQELQNCVSDKISSIVYKIAQNKSVERIELTCFLEKENLKDKYGNRVESERELMGTLVRNKAEIDDIRKYVDEDSYVREGPYLGSRRLGTDLRGNLTKIGSIFAIKCP